MDSCTFEDIITCHNHKTIDFVQMEKIEYGVQTSKVGTQDTVGRKGMVD